MSSQSWTVNVVRPLGRRAVGSQEQCQRLARTTSGSCVFSWPTKQRSSEAGGIGTAPERDGLSAGWMHLLPLNQHQHWKPWDELQRRKPDGGEAFLCCGQCQRYNPLSSHHLWSPCKCTNLHACTRTAIWGQVGGKADSPFLVSCWSVTINLFLNSCCGSLEGWLLGLNHSACSLALLQSCP